MNMKWYWGKIALTSLVIFGVGSGLLSVVRATRRQVVRTVETNADLTIPLPFLPFNIDGAKAGTFRKVVLHRSRPETVESADATVRLTDTTQLAKLRGCTAVTVDDPSRLSEKSSFRCATADSMMSPFGSLIITTIQDGEWARAAVIPLVLPPDVARRIQGHEAESHAAELEAARFRALGDSLQTLATRLRAAASDSIRESIEAEMESLDDEMQDLRRSMSEAAAGRTAEAPDVSIAKDQVTAPKAPKPPSVTQPPRPER